ncbi:aminopeptidase [Thermococcus litoralis DSM 5473]|uniref:Aminopeptidase n=4 Tax=Thermococcaceae TaxID=2259 RepID=Q8TZD0_PYRFU|nr:MULTISPECIES: M1 family aminopeptidase [Thermococcaceae]AAL82189.1 putative aminopeptidase [Pyrococcus furiosus DSM 3638]AFN04574.1 aminopeptidase [Pyrococcus furiosus COM1]EHR78291.1 aminopeptidase [Thermococcus litoralis DSM 5473]QEK79656.1 aminopeptidase [Pyrococcus furiosus DSM 3638]
MKRKALAVFLISFLVLSVGYILWSNNPVPSSKQEKLQLYIEYPSKVEEKSIYGAFPYFLTNYSVIANITVITLNHHLKVRWDFIITNRSGNYTVLYIKSPNFGRLSMVVEGVQVNISKLSRYSLPQYYAQVILLNVTYPKGIPIHGTLEYETTINSSFTKYILGDFVKFSPIYYPETYPSTIVFSTEWLLPISSVGILVNSNSLYNPIPEIYNLTLILPSNYIVLSDYYLPRVWHKDEKLVVMFKNVKPNPTNYRFIYIYNQNLFQKTKITIRNIKLIIYSPKNNYLNAQELANITAQIVWHYVDRLSILPYQEINVFFNPDIIFGEEFEYFGKGIIIVGFRAHHGFLRNEDILPTIAHELAHLWFGSYVHFGRLDESLATLMEFDVSELTGENLKEREDRAVRNFKRYGMPLAQVYQDGILDPQVRLGVEYYKGAFVFRSLQFVLGNETFFEGLRELLRECHGKECNLTDVQNVFEKVSGQDLDWFFKEWFYTAKVPDYEVKNLTVTQKNSKYSLTFEIVDKSNFTMPLEVEVITPKEKLVKKVWIRGEAKVSFELNDKPLKIILDPNEWMVNENKKDNVKGIEIIIE